MPKTKSEEAKIDFSGNPFFSGKFPSLLLKKTSKLNKIVVLHKEEKKISSGGFALTLVQNESISKKAQHLQKSDNSNGKEIIP